MSTAKVVGNLEGSWQHAGFDAAAMMQWLESDPSIVGAIAAEVARRQAAITGDHELTVDRVSWQDQFTAFNGNNTINGSYTSIPQSNESFVTAGLLTVKRPNFTHADAHTFLKRHAYRHTDIFELLSFGRHIRNTSNWLSVSEVYAIGSEDDTCAARIVNYDDSWKVELVGLSDIMSDNRAYLVALQR